MDFDCQSVKTAIEHTLVPLAGALNMKRRSDDDPRGIGPIGQFGLSVIVALIIGLVSGVSSGYISAQIALAVHTQRLNDHDKRIERTESKIDQYLYRIPR